MTFHLVLTTNTHLKRRCSAQRMRNPCSDFVLHPKIPFPRGVYDRQLHRVFGEKLRHFMNTDWKHDCLTKHKQNTESPILRGLHVPQSIREGWTETIYSVMRLKDINSVSLD